MIHLTLRDLRHDPLTFGFSVVGTAVVVFAGIFSLLQPGIPLVLLTVLALLALLPERRGACPRI